MDNFDPDEIKGKKTYISTLQRPQDMLFYLCLVAQKFSNNEGFEDITDARLKPISIFQCKMVLAFLSLVT